MLTLQVVLVILLFFIRGTYSKKVTCNHQNAFCDCMNPTDNLCELTLEIDMLQTFTRYQVDTTTTEENIRGNAGRVYNFDGKGELQPLGTGPCGKEKEFGSKDCTDPFTVDGNTFRSFIAVNGRIPGPTLIVTEDQLVKVTVINRLASESVSVHWHGMHQRNSNWMDGVEHVTQCGIPPGASFTYYFYARPYGTHWYHSHSGAQRTDGLFGALIVKEKDDTQIDEVLKRSGVDKTKYTDSPEQHTLTLLDWQRSSSLDLFTQIRSGIRYFKVDSVSQLQGSGDPRTYSSDGAEIGPVPYWSGLINGRGRHNDIDYSTVNKFELSDFKVTPGQKYRFRLIGAQSLYAYRFSIEKHKLIVIATDGQFIEPVTVEYIIIHSGERYDFFLQREDTVKERFMIRAVTLSFTATSTYETEQSAEAILNYNTAKTPSTQYDDIAGDVETVEVRCTPTKKCTALNCPFKNFPQNLNINCKHIHQLQLLTNYPANDLPTIAADDDSSSRLFFNFGFEGTRRTSAINARNLKLPSASLAQLNENELNDINNKEFCKELNDPNKCKRDIRNEVISPECYCTHVVGVEANKYIELVISATGPDYTVVDRDNSNFLFAHPVHLHGHYFHVVDIQFGDTNDQSGILIAGTQDINCGDQSRIDNPVLCNNPSWNGISSEMYNHENTGKINPKAPLKDTLLIPAGGYAVVYFKTDNPGWWFLHCHIEVHQLEGMGVIIDERGTKTTPPDGMNKCGNFSITAKAFIAATTASSSNSGGGVKCFPPDAVVRTRNGPLLMKDVEIGMEVLAVSSNHKLVYSPVILMLDVDDIKLANYTIIESSGNHKLTLTPNHLVHASKTNDISSSVPIFASQVKKGDMIFVAKSPDVIEAVEVVSTSSKVIKGAYAPLTREGTVVVNDVVASCYAVVNDHQFAHAAFGPIRYLYDTFNTSLHSKQKEGISWYPSMLQSLGKVFLDESNYKPRKVEDLIKSSD